MQVNDHEFNFDVFVAPSEDGLIGMDFLYAQNFVLSANGGLQLDGLLVPTEVQGLSTPVLGVNLTQDTVIPAYSECVAEGAVDIQLFGSWFGLVEPLGQGLRANDLVVGCTLVDSSS